MSLLGGMVAGADSIDDMDQLRHGTMAARAHHHSAGMRVDPDSDLV
ncbi:hypothetical protein [Actinacidiphila soli]